MGFSVLKVSILLLVFPMLAIPFVPLKIPPLYQITLFSLLLLFFLRVIDRRSISLLFIIYTLFMSMFLLYLVSIGSKLSQLFSIASYLLILMIVKYEFSNTILLHMGKIKRLLTFVYWFTLFIALTQIASYYGLGIVKLFPDNFYLTSEFYGTVLNSPVSGWSESFRPNAFFAEPSFLGFYICAYVAFCLDLGMKRKKAFVLANILLLYFLGIRSGGVVLSFLLVYMLLIDVVGVRVSRYIILAVVSAAVGSFLYFFVEIKLLANASRAIDYSTYERLSLLVLGMDVFFQNPFFGVGLGKLKDVFHHNSLYERDIANIGNLYIQLLAEIGIMGFAFIVLLVSRLYVGSFSLLVLLLSFFFIGGYSLLYTFFIPLLASIYKKSCYEGSFQK